MVILNVVPPPTHTLPKESAASTWGRRRDQWLVLMPSPPWRLYLGKEGGGGGEQVQEGETQREREREWVNEGKRKKNKRKFMEEGNGISNS